MLSGLMPPLPAGLALKAFMTSPWASAGSSVTNTLTLWSSVSNPMNDFARDRPTSGVMPTRTPGGKTGSAAKAGHMAATKRTTAGNSRVGFMKKSTGSALRPFNGRPLMAVFRRPRLVRSLLAVLMFRQQAKPRFGSLDAATCGVLLPTWQRMGRRQAGPGRADIIFQRPRLSTAKVAPWSLQANPLLLYEAHRRNIASI